MAKRKVTSPKGIGRPFPKTRNNRAPEPKPEPEAPLPETKEAIFEAMGSLCDQVDAVMATERTMERQPDRDFTSRWPVPKVWEPLYVRREALQQQLRKALEVEDEHNHAGAHIRTALGAPPGEVPSFARPGVFVIWVGFIPIGCVWNGFISPNAQMLAIDPERPWINEAGIKSGETTIRGTHKDIDEVFREEVTDWTVHIERGRNYKAPPKPTFQLVSLSSRGRKEVSSRLEQMPWLRDVIRRGPVNPIQMPSHIKSVQMALA